MKITLDQLNEAMTTAERADRIADDRAKVLADNAALRNEVEALRGLLAAQQTEPGESQITYDQRQQRVIRQYAAEVSRLKEEIEDWRGRLATQCGETLAARHERDRDQTIARLRSPTKELIEPLTGDTKVIDTNTGRIIETRRSPTATGEEDDAVDPAVARLFDCADGHSIQGMESFWENVRDALATAHAQGAQSMRDAVLRWHQEQWIKYREVSGTNAIAGAHMFAHQESIAEISILNVDKGEQ